MPNIDSCRRFTSAVFKAHLVACWLVDRGALIVPNTLAGKAARNLQTTEGFEHRWFDIDCSIYIDAHVSNMARMHAGLMVFHNVRVCKGEVKIKEIHDL